MEAFVNKDNNNLKLKSFGVKEVDINELKINPEYEAHQQKMSSPQWQAFLVSYKVNGQIEPIKVDAKTKEIYDGHHRHKAATLVGHRTMKAELVIVNDPIAYIKALNEARRHYTKFQLIEQALKEKPALLEQAKLNESLGGKGVEIPTPLDRVNKVIANRVIGAKVTEWDVYQVEQILKKGSKEQIEKARHTDKTDKIYNDIKSQDRKQKYLLISESKRAEFAKLEAKFKFKILEGEFQDRAKEIESGSVALVFVDSLYDEESLYLHKDLAIHTERILWGGGSYAVYLCPQWKEELIRSHITDNSNLHEYGRWIALMQGSFGGDYPNRMMYQSKSIAWYCKGEKPTGPLFEKRERMMDVIPSTRPDKTTSRFPQSVEDAIYIIGYLTNPNDWVVDLMMGEGTTGIAALLLGRRFIGIEKEHETGEIAKAKFYELLNNPNFDPKREQELDQARETKKKLDKIFEAERSLRLG